MGVLIPTLLLAACTPASQVRQFAGDTMGTTYRVTYVAAPGITPPSQKAVEDLLLEINESVSNYINFSAISRLNASRDTSASHAVDQHFATIFRKSRAIYEDTQGAFNPALGPLIDAWGFGPKQVQALPDVSTIRRLLKVVSLDAFDLQEDSPPLIRKRIAEAQLDFGGIAKGYGVDAISGLLDHSGVQDYLVEIAGEIRARGRRPEGNGWMVGIERPAENALAVRDIQTAVVLQNSALSTSGNYRNVREEDDRTIGHILDSKTGYPAMNSLLSATVIADDAMTADAYATALMVMGLEEALQFVEGHKELSAYLIGMDSDGKVIERRSSRFPK